MTIKQHVTFICDACQDEVSGDTPKDWYAIGRFFEQQFTVSRHMCAKCYSRVFEWCVLHEMVRPQ